MQDLLEELSSLEFAAIGNIPKEFTKLESKQKIISKIKKNCKRNHSIGYCSGCEKSVCGICTSGTSQIGNDCN